MLRLVSGVLTHERFLRQNLTEDSLEKFWNSGRHTINRIWADVTHVFGERGRENALDFGCGVGRLTKAIAEIAASVTGVDVSLEMIDEAKTRALANMSFSTGIPDKKFDWITHA